MSKEIIDSLRKIEANAKKDKADAVTEAKRIVSEAAENAKNKHDSAVLAAQKDMSDKLVMITEQTEALLLKNKTEAEAEAAKETEAAMANMDAAVSIIIGELAKNVGK